MPSTYTLEVQGRCHVGHVRKRNEDCIAIGPWSSRGEKSCSHSEFLALDESVSLVVSDGIGGHRGGNVASRMVVGELRGLQIDGEWEREVDEAIWQAEQAMSVAMARDPQLGGMGATVAGVVIQDGRIGHYNVGDSRVLLLRDGRLQLLSVDDRLGNSPVLTQAIGGYIAPQRRAKNLHAGEVEWAPGDLVLVCSDGLTDRVPQQDIEGLLGQLGPEAVEPLLERALEAGGQDNIAIIVARLLD